METETVSFSVMRQSLRLECRILFYVSRVVLAVRAMIEWNINWTGISSRKLDSLVHR